MTGLRVFQYRTTYVNGTPIVIYENVSSNAPLDQRLRLIEVAYVEENTSILEFLHGNIWPSKTALVIWERNQSIAMIINLLLNLIYRPYSSRWFARF